MALDSRRVWRSSTAHLTWLSQKKIVGDGEKLLTYLNSALKDLLGTDSLNPPKLNFVVHLTWLSQKAVGDGEKLLTYFNSALKVLLGTDIFLRGTNKF
jgi:hypothetical protein